jgi:hypothetical protein
MANTITLCAVGDVALYGDVATQMGRFGAAWPIAEMRETLSDNDVLFGNLECVILPPEYPDVELPAGQLATKYNTTGALREGGFTFINLANNHILDGGSLGMSYTEKVVSELGITTGGVGRTQTEARQLKVLNKKGLTIGFLCYAEDSNYTLGTSGPCYAYYSRDTVLEDIARCRKDVDVLVVSIHADLEFQETPSVPRRAISREIAEAGATLVLEHHPHVPQGVEMVGSSLIAYSLGDFCFPVYNSGYLRSQLPRTAQSFVLRAEVGKEGVASFSREPFQIMPPPNQRPVPLSGCARKDMLDYFDELDEKLQDDELVARNWREISLRHFEIYLDRMTVAQSSMAVRCLLGKLMFVAENREWMNEAHRAILEEWRQRPQPEDPFHPPSHHFPKARDASLLDRVLQRAIRLVRKFGR